MNRSTVGPATERAARSADRSYRSKAVAANAHLHDMAGEDDELAAGHLKRALAELQAAKRTNARLVQRLAQLKEEVAVARKFAYHDELTGLPNRSLLLNRLDQAMAQALRHRTNVALLFLDLDGFKSVNDGQGHDVGDRILQQVAARITGCVRKGDTVCRYGGDEFIVMLPQIDNERCAEIAADKIRKHLAVPYQVDGHTIELTASIGIAIYRPDEHAGNHRSELIRQADSAMYLAKARRRNARTHHIEKPISIMMSSERVMR